MKIREEIVEFLEEKQGYQKCSPFKIKLALENKGYDFTEEECKQALQFVKTGEISTDKEVLEQVVEDNKIPEGFEVKSKWQNAAGEWLMSLKPTVEAGQGIAPEDYYSVFQDIISKKNVEETVVVDLNILPYGVTVEEHLDNLKFDYTTKEVKVIDTCRTHWNRQDLKVWTSDKHIGAIGSEDNDYSAEVFEDRMNKLFDHIIYLVKTNGVFETITIADLGDALDGMDGFTVSRQHRLKQNMDNKQMFETYFRVHKKFFDKLFASGAAKKYQLWNITNSNHDGDFLYVANAALMAYIEGVYPEVKVEVLDKFMNHLNHEGIDYILTHGKDKENRKFGLPLYPDAKTESFIEAFLKRMDIPRKARIRLVKGDLHMSSSAPCKNIEKYKTVSSMFGSSQWVLDNFELTEAGIDYEILDLDTEIISEATLKF
jgi:hypothetical protein